MRGFFFAFPFGVFLRLAFRSAGGVFRAVILRLFTFAFFDPGFDKFFKRQDLRTGVGLDAFRQSLGIVRNQGRGFDGT